MCKRNKQMVENYFKALLGRYRLRKIKNNNTDKYQSKNVSCNKKKLFL